MSGELYADKRCSGKTTFVIQEAVKQAKRHRIFPETEAPACIIVANASMERDIVRQLSKIGASDVAVCSIYQYKMQNGRNYKFFVDEAMMCLNSLFNNRLEFATATKDYIYPLPTKIERNENEKIITELKSFSNEDKAKLHNAFERLRSIIDEFERL